jgi:HlyD family secretion protein
MYYITVVIPNPGALTVGQNAQAVIHTSNGLEPGYEPGTLEWVQTVTVKAGVSGNIKQLYVDENTYVKKGQKLAYLEGDSASTDLVSQKLRLEQARLDLNESQKKLADCKIYAPVDGTNNLNRQSASQGSSAGSSNSSSSTTESSGEDYLRVGDQVSSNQVLANIIGAAGMTVTVPVDEVDIAKIKAGQTAAITADALPDRTFNGTVSEIAAKGTDQNGVATFDVTVSIDQAEGLKENMTANVEILVARKEGVLLLPVEAVQERQGRKFVLVPTNEDNSQPAGNTEGAGNGSRLSGSGTGGNGNRPVGMVTVKTGLYNDSMIEITSGLQEGDIVNLAGVARSSGTSSGGTGGAGGSSNRTGGFGIPGGGMSPR